MINRSALFGLVAGASIAVSAAAAFAVTPTNLDIDMWNKTDGSQGMTLETDHVSSGKVNFVVRNTSASELHELLIVKTDLPLDQFADNADGTKIDETKLTGITEVGDIKPGNTGNLTLDLTPGRYVLFCNQEGHFHAGMHAELIVN